MTSVTARVVGRERLSRVLSDKAKQYKSFANAGLEAWAQIVRNAAVLSIQKGSKTGVVYSYGKTGRSHQSSAPGEAPATWTGDLVGSIGWNVDASQLIAEVFATSAHAVPLETGTRHMAARPFMVPALKDTRDRGLSIFKATMARAD